ncbi:MAG: Rrf2 family transcriptional regulator [Chloroflexota bacterium]|nr:Rrf2 family transcriptional regulator [Chloroflexota bacterium]
MTSSRFAVAVHLTALAMLAGAKAADERLTSGCMAASVGTNPVVVRRILGALREAGLVASQPGPGGGWRPTREPSRVSLLDIYRAVAAGPALALPPEHDSPPCPVGRTMRRALGGVFRDAEAALEARLAAVTMADVLEEALGGCPAASSLGSPRGGPSGP